jgi:hypothetical protein
MIAARESLANAAQANLSDQCDANMKKRPKKTDDGQTGRG